MPELNVNKAIGEQPNEIWLRTGQITFFMAILSYIGFNGFGVEIGAHTDLAPFVLGSAAIFQMAYGTKLRERKNIAAQKHELALANRKVATPKEKRTRGEDEYLLFFKNLPLPISPRDLVSHEFGYDKKYSDEVRDVLNILNIKRAESERKYYDEITFIDGKYNLKSNLADGTIIQ